MNKLYLKLAWSNLKNSRQFYLPYVIAGMLSAMMFYTMCAIQGNEGLSKMRGGASVQMVLFFGVIVVGVFVSIFLFYTNSFIMKRRKKELGIYNILGMEKIHIAKIMAWETVFSFLIAVGGGLILGIVFQKLLTMFLYRLTGLDAAIPFYISGWGCLHTAELFGAIYVCILLYNLMQIRLSNPVELLHSGSTGEREPKTKILQAVLGVVCIAAGYYMAITVDNPVKAITLFFVAVMLVIIGTYWLFNAGSIAFLKLLRKNKRYYYQTRHFTTVSGMIYRMKQNAVGLANICILSTMVLVVISMTVCMYAGLEDELKTQYPAELEVLFYDPDGQQDSGTFDRMTDENVVENVVKADTISTDARKQELYIDLITKVNDISVSYRTSGEIIFKDNTSLELEDEFTWDGRYYVYGYGTFQGSRTQLESAITLAYDTYGTVVDCDSKSVWKRYRSTQASIDGVSPVMGGSSLENAVTTVCNYLGADYNAAAYMEQGYTAVQTMNMISGVHGISLTGITYEKALSYVGEGSLVIAKTGEDEYIIITAYNSSEIAYIESSYGSVKTMSMNDAGKMFSQGGNIYVTYYK